MKDILYSIRMLRRSPVTTAVAICSLALGIGANTAIFSLMNALILRTLPIRDPGQLVRLTSKTSQNPDREIPFSLAMYQELKKDQQLFDGLFGWMGGGVTNLEANGARYVGSSSTVTGEYFATLGIQPVLGRFITPEDLNLESGSPAPVVVLSYNCWKLRYNGDPGVIGKTIRVEERPMTIIGVTPENFAGLIIDVASDVTLPIGYSGRTSYRDKTSFGLEIYGRLKSGITVDQARAQLESLWPAVQLATIPEAFTGVQRESFLNRKIAMSSAATGSSFMRLRYAKPLYLLMAMVGVLLLIGCINLANLMLARASARRQEFGIRLALGAGKWRIIRQMLTESLMLSISGSVLGLIVAYWACGLLIKTMWSGLVPSALNAQPDRRVLLFTVLVSVLTGLVVGISPAWKIFRGDPAGALRQNTRRVHGGQGGLGRVLIGVQMALSLVLVIGAVLFVRSLEKLRSIDVGFRRDGVLIIQMFPQKGAAGQTMPNRAGYYQELVQRIEQLPQVESVSYSHMGPVLSYEYKQPASVPSVQIAPAPAVFEAVGPRFFHLAGMRLLAGREFEWRDNESAPPVAILSESLARHLFPRGDAIGRTIDFGDRKGLQVIGVVNSASLWMPQSHQPMAVYVALMQLPNYNSSSLDIRTSGDPMAVLSSVRGVLTSMGRHTDLKSETLEQRASKFLTTERMIAMLSTFFGGLALLLASVGLYGLMSYAVARRTSEIGLRMALGARPANVQSLILKEVLWLLCAGMAIGIPAALAASRLVSNLIFGVAGTDPATILVAAGILLAVALTAGYLPARRASRIDPMMALRAE